MREDLKCYICNNKLTKEEIEDYFEYSEYYCNGMPIDPPTCDKCSKKWGVID